LIVINILVSVLIYIFSLITKVDYGRLLTVFGSKNNYLIMYNEQYWRFLTPIFLHGGKLHLTMNCISLYALGNVVERLYGKWRFIVIYFLSGLIGSLVSFCFSINDAVGASGAIFGLLGALIYFYLEKPDIAFKFFGKNIFIILAINLVYGFSVSGIDNYAHIRGLIGGFLTIWSFNLGNYNSKRWYYERVIGLALLISISLGGILYGFKNEKNQLMKLVGEMYYYVEINENDKAVDIAKKILNKDTKSDLINYKANLVLSIFK
jgi:rhomboid protease GluP